MIRTIQTPNPASDQPEERRRELSTVKQVKEVKSQQREIIRRINARVYPPQEPLVVIYDSLFHRRIPLQRLLSKCWSKQIDARGMDIVALVQLPFHVRQSHHDGQILPHVALAQFQCFAHLVGCAECGTRDLAIANAQNAFAFETVEVFGEAAAVGV